MEHHKIIAKMLKERLESKKTNNLKSNFKLDESSKKSNEFKSTINLKNKQDLNKPLQKEEVVKKSKKEPLITDYYEYEKVDDKRCPICGNDLIDKGFGILQCEKVNCTYSRSSRPKFKPRIIDPDPIDWYTNV